MFATRLRVILTVILGTCAVIPLVRADDAHSVGKDTRVNPPTTGRDLVLEIKTEKTEYTTADWIALKATIRNTGPTPVLLIQPGDASDCGWRTPRVAWSILPVDELNQRHPDAMPPPRGGARCGNRNGLRVEEIFVLKPGETKTLGEWGGIYRVPEGKQRLVFYYQNDPDFQKWNGLSNDDPLALMQVKKTLPCLLKSNEITLTIKKAEK